MLFLGVIMVLELIFWEGSPQSELFSLSPYKAANFLNQKLRYL